MADEVAFTTWQSRALRDQFVLSCHAQNLHARDVLREMMISWLERRGIEVPDEKRVEVVR